MCRNISLSSMSALQARLTSPAAAEAFSPLCGMSYALVALDGDVSAAAACRPNCPVIGIGEVDRMDAVPDLVDVAVESEAGSGSCHRSDQAKSDRLDDAGGASATQRARLDRGCLACRVSRLFHPAARCGIPVVARFASGAPSRPRPRAARACRAGERRAAYHAEPLPQAQCLLFRPARWAMRSAPPRGGRSRHREGDPSRRGRLFSALGGDLDEFGEAADAGLAHASRLTRSAGAALHALRDRVEARLHGACVGAGIELPAFVNRVVARDDAFFQLPEVSMGLVPGAGGTASILPRIGRRRLAYMALTGVRIDAATALEWGLVDEIESG